MPPDKAMKSGPAPALVLVLFYACFLAFWAWSGPQLPERVATHFNGSGEPNGWMSRSTSQNFMLIFGLVFPLFVVLLSSIVRFLPVSVINLPHREYWLAPERREETIDYLLWHSLWFACLSVCFVIGMQYSIVKANQQTPPHLDTSFLLRMAGLFLAGTVVWVLILIQRFRHSA
jgi:uncharacterized membrane protein